MIRYPSVIIKDGLQNYGGHDPVLKDSKVRPKSQKDTVAIFTG